MWYIRVFEGGIEANGSDSASKCDYVRKDCVRKFVTALSKTKWHDKRCIAVYAITEAQFWHVNWGDVKELRKHGKEVWSLRDVEYAVAKYHFGEKIAEELYGND